MPKPASTRLVAATSIAALLAQPSCGSSPSGPHEAVGVAARTVGSTAPIVLPGGGGVTDRGASTYSIPLWVPAGPRGMQPGLSLEYSGTNNGLLGVGFALSGISTIAPCSATFASEGYANDGDRYCLDGVKLVPHVEPGFRPPDDAIAQYRTEVETFQHVVARAPGPSGLPTQFTVFLRDGGRRVYLAVTGQRTTNEHAHSALAVSGTVPVMYRLAQAFDHNENRIDYSYEDSDAVEPYELASRLRRIQYSFAGGSKPNRKVELEYENRPDTLVQYTNGVKIVTRSRLIRLEMWALDASASHELGMEQVWRYELDYGAPSDDTGRSLLRHVRLCDRSDVCSFTRTFSWSTATDIAPVEVLDDITDQEFDAKAMGYDYDTVAAYQLDQTQNWIRGNDTRLLLFDADADGDDDAIYRTRRSGVDRNGNGYSITAGKLGVRITTPGAPLGTKHDVSDLLEPNLKEAAADVTDAVPHLFSFVNLGKTRIADFNQDGLPDLMLARTRIDQNQVWAADPASSGGSNGNGYDAQFIHRWEYGFTTLTGHPWNHTADRPYWQTAHPGLDTVWVKGAMLRWFYESGQATPSEYGYKPPPFQRVAADLDGDAIVDILEPFYRDPLDNNPSDILDLSLNWDVEWANPQTYVTHPTRYFARLSMDRTEQPPVPAQAFGFGWSCANDFASVTDVNGDGRQDVLVLDASNQANFTIDPILGTGTYVQLTLGDGFPHGNGTFSSTSALWAGTCKNPADVVMGDWNGDGLVDALYPPNAYNGNPEPLVRWNLGTGFGPLVPFGLEGDPASAARLEQPTPMGRRNERISWDRGTRVADVDGDGRDDIIAVRQDNAQCVTDVLARLDPSNRHPDCLNYVIAFRSRGDRFVAEPLFSTNRAIANLAHGFVTAQLGDVTGDGRLDFVHVKDSKLFALELPWRKVPDLLERIEDASAAVPLETFEYTQAWWGAGARPEATAANPMGPAVCAWPLTCAPRGATVVRTHRTFAGTRWDSVPMQRTQTHEYASPKASMIGRGFLGFAVHERWDRERGTYTRRNFSNDRMVDLGASPGGMFYPRAQLPDSETVVTPRSALPGDGDLASSSIAPGLAAGGHSVRTSFTTTSYAYQPLEDGRILGVLPKRVTSYEVDNAATLAIDGEAFARFVDTSISGTGTVTTIASEHDSFGNLTRQTTEIGDGSTVLVRRSLTAKHDNRITDWHVGLPTFVSVRAGSATSSLPARITRSTYDERGNLGTYALRSASPSCLVEDCEELHTTTTYTHDPLGNVTETAVAAGSEIRTTKTTWESEGVYPSGTENALGHTTTMTIHPSLGVPTAIFDANTVQTSFTYDGFGRVREIARTGAPTVTRSYEVVTVNGQRGFRIKDQRSDGLESYARTDELGRVVETGKTAFGDNGWIYNRQNFDVVGNVVKVANPDHSLAPTSWTSTGYDRLGRRQNQITPDGKITWFAYSKRRAITTDPEGHVTFVDADAAGRVVKSGHLSGTRELSPMTFTYGAFDQLTTRTDVAGNVYTREHDALGRVTYEEDPDTGTRRVYYNGFSEPIGIVDPEGTVIHDYDALGRIVETASADGITTRTYDTGSGAKGKPSTVSSPDGVVTVYGYDALGRRQIEIQGVDGESDAIIYRYDALGRIRYKIYPSVPNQPTFKVGYEWGANGYLTSLRDASACDVTLTNALPATCDGPVLWRIDDRDARQQITSERFGPNLLSVTHDYDPVSGRLASYTSPAGTTRYEYNDDGQLSSRTEGTRTETFIYDEMHRLSSWALHAPVSTQVPPVVNGYRYDNVGNLVSVDRDGVTTFSGVYHWQGRPHALAGSTAGTYAYDGKGRQTESAGRTIEYNARDLPKRIRMNTFDRDFKYDGDGRRAVKSFQGTTRYFGRDYEHRQPFSGVETHVFYVHGDGGLVAQVDLAWGTKRTRFFVGDRLGSPTTILSETGLAEHAYFDPFGHRVTSSGTPATDPDRSTTIGFTGHVEDDWNLVHMQGRVYDRDQYRFLTPDPLVADPLFSQAYNPYSYAHHDPLNVVDPTGFGSVTVEPPAGGNGDGPPPVTGTAPPPAQAPAGTPGGSTHTDKPAPPTKEGPSAPSASDSTPESKPTEKETEKKKEKPSSVPDVADSNEMHAFSPTADLVGNLWRTTSEPGSSFFLRGQAATLGIGLLPLIVQEYAGSAIVLSPIALYDSWHKTGEHYDRAKRVDAAGMDEASTDAWLEFAQNACVSVAESAASLIDGAAAKQGLSAGATLVSRAKGAAGVRQFKSELLGAGGEIVGEEITLKVLGITTRVDILVKMPKSKRLVMFEIKAGPFARWTKNQLKSIPEMWKTGATPTGKNAAEAGLEVGKPTGPLEHYTVHYDWF